MNTALSLQLITDAVIASYIHDISVRHGQDGPATDRGQQTRTTGPNLASPVTPLPG